MRIASMPFLVTGLALAAVSTAHAGLLHGPHLAVEQAAPHRMQPIPAPSTGSAKADRSKRVQADRPGLVRLRIEPPTVVLEGAGVRQGVLVTAVYADGSVKDVTHAASLTLAPSGRAVLSPAAVLSAKADGDARLAVSFGGESASCPVKVQNSHISRPVSFNNDIVPLFTRIGCNGGSCHGAAAGQNGFKLSLRGFDPAFDYEQIVKDANGKRVDHAHPAMSLVFQKPGGLVSHGGGLRLPPGSRERWLLLRWLKEGMAPPDDKVKLVDVKVAPVERVLPAGASQQLLVTGLYSDGSRRDVTSMARYSSSDDGVAAVDDSGLVSAKRGGEAAITVAYGGLVKAPRFVTPIGKTPVLQSELPPNNAIDEAVYERLALLRIHPSGLCTDAEFLRRATLDATGTLPTEDEVRAFLADKRPDRRERLIDRLLDRPEYVDFRALKLSDLLRVNSFYLSEEGAEAYYQWIHQKVAANTPWDELVREALLARGPNFHDGPANYYRVATDPPQLAEATAQTFLGIRMQCARCHNHPFEKWTQNDYYSFAAYFARVGLKGGPEFGEETVVVRSGGEVNHPKTNAVMPPHPLGGPVPQLADGEDRRKALADWMTSPQNLDFAREMANRVWADFFGKGITDPVDDVRVSNPPSNEKLIDLLGSEFIAHHYDVKWLIRFIMNSRTYQLSSRTTPTNLLDTRHFARALPRRMSAEEALDALDAVTGKSDYFGNLPLGTRAVQLSDGRMGNYFLEVLGKPKREILCACERDMQPNLSQSLHFINSDEINNKLASDDGWLHRQIKAGALDADIIDSLYLKALGRYPSSREMHLALVMVSGEDNAAAAGADKEMDGSKVSGSKAADKADRKLADPIGKGSGEKQPEAAVKAAAPPTNTGAKGSTVKAAAAVKTTAVKTTAALLAPPKPKAPKVTPQERTAALEDIAWAVLNSKEFLFNH